MFNSNERGLYFGPIKTGFEGQNPYYFKQIAGENQVTQGFEPVDSRSSWKVKIESHNGPEAAFSAFNAHTCNVYNIPLKVGNFWRIPGTNLIIAHVA